ncbi:LolA family protein [Asanoa iriomotensis]|uniref:Outer membrane lipoprotein-sorting protein n=1 Tax=Asanoa iriomotensis TaxID=234613 RepID=A0ABQ4CAC9_9ACTN|nr:hypothetical protein [Asanoa iriomotensis]GIF59735.1 hypothetical protein Air01nite_58300 [Asanoa iriomotensis]
MSVLTKRPVLRWLVPATAAAAVIGGGAAVATVAGAADPTLPERSAAQLLVDLQTARLDGLSGTVVTRADLGLPPIVSLAGMLGGDNLASLIDGQHTLRVWYAGPDKARVSLQGGNEQTDLIKNGTDAWVWSSRAKTANHLKLDVDGDHGAPPAGVPTSPQEAADLALKAIEPSTQVTVGRSTQIAGRDAYELNLIPRDHASLVGQVSIAIDATEHVPLRFRLYPASSDKPAFEVAFTMVSFDRPDDAQFAFNPPAGTKVTEAGDKLTGDQARKDAEARKQELAKELAERPAGSGPKLIGEGWTTVVMAKTDPKQQGADAPQISGLLGQLPKVSGDWGSGRLFTSRIVTGLLTDDGRVFVGAVSPEKLYELAATNR